MPRKASLRGLPAARNPAVSQNLTNLPAARGRGVDREGVLRCSPIERASSIIISRLESVSQLWHGASLHLFNQPFATGPHQIVIRESMNLDFLGLCVDVEAFKIQMGAVAVHLETIR